MDADLTRTSPRFPVHDPSMYSSVLASWRFMYPSVETRKPLYSWPHLSFTITAFPVRELRKGFGFIGIVDMVRRRGWARSLRSECKGQAGANVRLGREDYREDAMVCLVNFVFVQLPKCDRG